MRTDLDGAVSVALSQGQASKLQGERGADPAAVLGTTRLPRAYTVP
jgi:hypothetical protein